MKRIIPFLFMFFMGISAMAQSISVADFQLRETDMTAASLAGRRVDQNGQPAALIRIETTETGFVFEAGALGIVDSKQETGEVWVWVPRASRKITIKHPKLGVLYDYRYPLEIESESTYWMKLVTGKVITTIEEEVRQQYLIFQLTPPDAALEVDDQLWPVSAEGTARKFVNFGTYTYRVQAPNYYPEAGRVTVDDPNKKETVTVTLRPNFGWVEVRGGNVEGATVYVDNALIGKAPCKSEGLKSGEHTVKIAREMYAPYTERVTVRDNETTTLSPQLTADFARVTLTVDADAEIWVNDEKKGIRTWTGNLASGTHRIECRMENHENSANTKDIDNGMDGQTITLAAPRPIYGSLNVESTPDYAKIFIDGKPMGETPNFIAQILIGQHEIKLTKDGYNDYTETIVIAKGERKQISAALNSVEYERIAKKGDEYYDAKNYEEALKCYREAAEHGNAAGQNGMGRLYHGGFGVQQDYAEAVRWYRSAAEQGFDRAQYNLGFRYYFGNGVDQDYVESAKWFRKAADQGLALAQYELGQMYYSGWGVTQDNSEAKRWIIKAAEQGDAEIQCMAGACFSLRKDYTEAMKWYLKSAEQGNSQAQWFLGIAYEKGEGVAQNGSEAVKWYVASEQEQPTSSLRLGDMYYDGRAVAKNYSEAKKWYLRYLEKERPIYITDVAYKLGYMHYVGTNGIAQDYKEAVKWYRIAAEKGSSAAQCNLGYMYFYGYGVTQDYAEANKWYRKAAEQGNDVAQYNLGVNFEYGKGVKKSKKEAKKWYQMAADQGYEDAIKALDRLK